jgi:hypothetical protein
MTAPGWSFGWQRNRYGNPVFVATPPAGEPIHYGGTPDGIRRRLLAEKSLVGWHAIGGGGLGGDALVDALRAALAVEPTEVEHG